MLLFLHYMQSKMERIGVLQEVMPYEGSWILGIYENMEDALMVIKNKKINDYVYYKIEEYKLNNTGSYIQRHIYNKESKKLDII